MSLLNKFKNKYIIEGTIIAESAIHVGSGGNDFTPTATDNPIITDADGNPFIPGTSLKGVIRSFMERLLAAGIFENFTSCNIVSDPCMSDKKLKALKDAGKSKIKKLKDTRNSELNKIEKEKEDNKISEEEYLLQKESIIDEYDKKIPEAEKETAENIYNGQCDICKLFGGNGVTSKIKISDCRLEKKSIIGTRDGVAIDRDTLTAADGKKYTFECVAPGARFKFEMTVDNLDKQHKELLKIILKVLENGELAVGGKTSAGLGKIKLDDIEIYKIENKEKLRNYFLGEIDKSEFKGEL